MELQNTKVSETKLEIEKNACRCRQNCWEEEVAMTIIVVMVAGDGTGSHYSRCHWCWY